MRYFTYLLILLLFACGKPVQQIVQQIHVNSWLPPLDRGEIILVNLPAGFSQKDYRTFLETLPQELKSYGFREVWDTDYHEIELKSVGIRDFTTERNREKLYAELGVRYLLDLEIVNKKYARLSKLGATMLYNESNQNSSVVGSSLWTYPDYWIHTNYILYDLAEKDVLVELDVRTTHLDNNTVYPKSIKKDIQTLFMYIYSEGL
ncbi:hypothetical protein Belba_1802 [Belliella baltica DSM 15883]|uniref:Lipoprotein n=1 Tax=Belliella baltica (strain DSM 15883 / CIP 108006 / LMG 21964 / BA134) TaxID=866536 RepID=I3Z581_BELBD|nr:hypothetical protein [Belliella baltica]AFL84399.1 hypothetical protein Belba_1802 [Belliella baltica DSM 15883]